MNGFSPLFFEDFGALFCFCPDFFLSVLIATPAATSATPIATKAIGFEAIKFDTSPLPDEKGLLLGLL